MDRHKDVQFAVYYNLANKHVEVHKIGFCNLYKKNGIHMNQQGGWGYFVEDYEAQLFAKSMSKLKKLLQLNHEVCFRKSLINPNDDP